MGKGIAVVVFCMSHNVDIMLEHKHTCLNQIQFLKLSCNSGPLFCQARENCSPLLKSIFWSLKFNTCCNFGSQSSLRKWQFSPPPKIKWWFIAPVWTIKPIFKHFTKSIWSLYDFGSVFRVLQQIINKKFFG